MWALQASSVTGFPLAGNCQWGSCLAPFWVFICVDRAQFHLLLLVQVSVLTPSSGVPLASKGINKSLQSSLAPVVYTPE